MYLKKGFSSVSGGSLQGCPEYILPNKDSSRPAALVNPSNLFV